MWLGATALTPNGIRIDSHRELSADFRIEIEIVKARGN